MGGSIGLLTALSALRGGTPSRARSASAGWSSGLADETFPSCRRISVLDLIVIPAD
jgi:hypothetical protein